jgi:hypothetical protein
MRRARVVTLVATAAALLAGPTAAWATFPGQNGRLAFSAGADIWTIRPDGTGAVNLTNTDGGVRNEEACAWSPDGRRIAFQASEADGTNVYVMDADGGNVTRLTADNVSQLPDWSPDGKRIVFNQGNAIAVMNADGSGVHRITDGAVPEALPKWAPNGGRIAFISQREGTNELWTMNPDGSDPRRLTPGILVGSADWSPDSSQIAFEAPVLSQSLFTIGAAGGAIREVPETRFPTLSDNPSTYPAFSPDGTSLAFSGGDEGTIHTLRLNRTRHASMFDLPPATSIDWQPRGPSGRLGDEVILSGVIRRLPGARTSIVDAAGRTHELRGTTGQEAQFSAVVGLRLGVSGTAVGNAATFPVQVSTFVVEPGGVIDGRKVFITGPSRLLPDGSAVVADALGIPHVLVGPLGPDAAALIGQRVTVIGQAQVSGLVSLIAYPVVPSAVLEPLP